MSHYEGNQNNLRNPYAQYSIPMDEDMPIKPEVEVQWLKDEVAELKKELAEQKRSAPPRRRKAPVKRPPTARETTTRATKKQTAHAGNRPVKKLPPMRTPGEQPRDSFGRFARKTGAVLWGAAKGTVKAVKSTAKAAQSAHKTVKRVSANARRRANLEARERRIALAEREKKLGLRKKKVTRRRKR